MTARFKLNVNCSESLRLSLFRIVVVSSIVLHFAPSIVAFEDNYSTAAYRHTAWDNKLHGVLAQYLPEFGVWLLVSSAIFGSLFMLLGIALRTCAALAGASWYLLACLNSFHTQTLALSAVWAILWCWAIVGGGDEWSVCGSVVSTPRPRSVVLQNAVAIYLLGTVFFSGVHKLYSGWPWSATMYKLAHYPEGYLLRMWAEPWWKRVDETTGMLLETTVLAIELVSPILICVPRTRWVGIVAHAGLFVLICATMEVPVLFGGVYLGASLIYPALNPADAVKHMKGSA